MENLNLDHNKLRRMLHDDLKLIDPFVSQLIQSETDQQMQKLILVPSVSAAPEAVLEALGSQFQNVCAEGHPAYRLSHVVEADLQDVAFHLADNRRYANRRFYKGVNYVDLVESLAKRRCAALFAHGRLRPEHLFVNVQALSGGTANLAVYQGLMNPGDTLMGMSLNEGGHLSHGAAVNLSGQLYRIVSYGVDNLTELLDYEAIRQLALEERPQVIVAGYTSYPWQPDWEAFRAIADEVNAFLVADIAHTAGLVIAGEMPNPVGIADVTTLTTNKTLLGPRSAIVITTNRSIARAIDNAIFPGAQGAPHPNKFAAVSVALGLAATAEFRALQSQIVANAKALAASLERCGMRLVYGGTNTHLFVTDLKSIPSPTGEVLYGEPASRILELAGIIVNRNTIPGDKSSPLATGLRMGTPWITQRGLNGIDMERLANLIYQILSNIHPFTYNGLKGLLPRGKIDFEILEEVKQGIQELVQQKAYQVTQNQPVLKLDNKPTGINISGQRARQFVQQMTTTNVARLETGKAAGTFLLDRHGKLIAPVYVQYEGENGNGGDIYCLVPPKNKLERVMKWLSAVSDGYVLFDETDIWRKVEGPVVLEQVTLSKSMEDNSRVWMGNVSDTLDSDSRIVSAKEILNAFPEAVELCQPYFVGQSHFGKPTQISKKRKWQFDESGVVEQTLRRTTLYEQHELLGAKMTPFAGWEMPLRYNAVLEEHSAVRQAAGLFDVSHMGLIEISGPAATTFLDVIFSNYIARLNPGLSCYGFILDFEGAVLDDAIVYCLNHNQYWLVLNAANTERVWDWLHAINNRQVIIDRNRPWIGIEGTVTIKNLKAEDGPIWQLLAFQGPASLKTLIAVLENQEAILALRTLNRQQFTAIDWHGTTLYIARTGYTGEELGFEIFTTAKQAHQLWQAILSQGKAFGVLPAGLAARDSLRTEAGLPLWGQELAGPMAISPVEAGFEGFVKYHKPFFIGRQPLLEKESKRDRAIIRFLVDVEKARRPYLGDPVLDDRGRQVGQVTSCSINSGKRLQGMALVDRKYCDPDTALAVVPLRGRPLTEMVTAKNQAILPIPITVLQRFPDRTWK